MNLLLFSEDEICDGRVVLRERRARHLLSVLGVAPGTRLRAGVARGPTGMATVTWTGTDAVEVTFEAEHNPAPPTLSLVLAMPRPKALPRILQDLATWGVARIDLVNAWRVEKGFLRSRRLEQAALTRELWLGCEQGGQTFVPEVFVHPLFRALLEGELGPRLAAGATGVVADPRAPTLLEQVIEPGRQDRVILAIGPDGGWVEAELDSFRRIDFRAARSGHATLRTEAAVSALLAQVVLLRRLANGLER